MGSLLAAGVGAAGGFLLGLRASLGIPFSSAYLALALFMIGGRRLFAGLCFAGMAICLFSLSVAVVSDLRRRPLPLTLLKWSSRLLVVLCVASMLALNQERFRGGVLYTVFVLVPACMQAYVFQACEAASASPPGTGASAPDVPRGEPARSTTPD
jgi:hypothetical protein